MARRRANGEGTIYRRKDGRYEAAVYVLTTSGARKRIRRYASTREEAHKLLTAAKMQEQQGIPAPDRSWRLGGYFDYWLENVVRPTKRPKTYVQYEMIVRLYLKPGLGTCLLSRLSVPVLQDFLNQKIRQRHSIRKVHIMRMVLSAALTRAQREELVSRNVARLVELPTYHRPEIQPWSIGEARDFLNAARADSLYPAFLILLLYGLRQGEVLGLRWQDIDLASAAIHIRQQLQRVGGMTFQGPLKTKAGRRDLPLMSLARDVLVSQRTRQDAARATAVSEWMGGSTGNGLVFTTRSGRPIDPRNLLRSFHQICDRAGIRHIRLHDLRHTQATLLEALGVSPREAQLILGHAHVSTTEQIYTHPGMDSRRQALEQVEALFLRAPMGWSSRQTVAVRPPGITGRQLFNLEPTEGFEPTTRCLQIPPLLYSTQERQSVLEVLEGYAQQWLIGSIAVGAGRQAHSSAPSAFQTERPTILWSVLSYWLDLIANLQDHNTIGNLRPPGPEEAPCSAE
jgi:integrase